MGQSRFETELPKKACRMDLLNRSTFRDDIMTIQRVRIFIATISASALFAGCVSVNIGGEKAERSKGVRLFQPKDPYTEIEGSRADGAWRNPANGNSISYFSTCNEAADPSLENATTELFADLKQLVIKRQATTTFNGREALDSEVEGKMEGIATRVRAIVFKKNGCLYTLSHVGVASKFDEDRQAFDSFAKGFEAP